MVDTIKRIFKIFTTIAVVQLIVFGVIHMYSGDILNYGNDDLVVESNLRVMYSPNEDKLCKIYFYDVEKNEKLFVSRNIKGTDEFMYAVLNNLSIPPIGISGLTTDVKIEILSCEKINTKGIIDLSTNFVDGMGFSEKYEQIYLELLINTLCDAMNVDEIMIRKNGKEYSSKNIRFLDGTFHKANVEEYKEYVR